MSSPRIWSLRASLLAGLGLGLGLGTGCFEDQSATCPVGKRGCRCQSGSCDAGLLCHLGYCIDEDCIPGEAYCSCDDGVCVGESVCFDAAVCIPPGGTLPDTSAGGTGDSAADDGAGTVGAATTSVGADSTGVPPTGCTPGDPCGDCRTCDANGTCAVDVGMPCDGPTIACGEYVWGLQDGTCYALADMEIGARCDAFAECVMPAVGDCPAMQGAAVVECDEGCVAAPGVCAANAPIETVTLDAMCVAAGMTPGCMPYCFNGSGSKLNFRTCSGGQCIGDAARDVDCEAYACEDGACNTSCVNSSDCAFFYYCDGSVCVLP